MSKYTAKFNPAFTLIELLVIIGITTLLAGMFLANYRQGEKSRNVRIAADSLASAFRLMQNNTLAGLAHPAPSGSCKGLRDYMVTVDQGAGGNTSYKTSAEEKDASVPVPAVCGAPTPLETVNLPSNVVVENILIDTTAPGGGTAVNALEVRFFPPFGKITMKASCATGCAPYDAGEVSGKIATLDVKYQGSSLTRTLYIDGLSGRIEVK